MDKTKMIQTVNSLIVGTKHTAKIFSYALLFDQVNTLSDDENH